MLVATFGPTTGWVGKTITYEGQQYVLEGHGPISASDVLNYDEQGHLVWGSDEFRAWVISSAQAPAGGPGGNREPEGTRTPEEPLADEGVVVAQGVNGSLDVRPDRITIRRKGALAFMTQGLKGDKEIAVEQVSSVQFKAAGMTNGYIQFAFVGGTEQKNGIWDATRDENTIMFSKKQQPAFEKAKALIDHHRAAFRDAARTPAAAASHADELEKFAALRDKGIISMEEFDAKKRQILGL